MAKRLGVIGTGLMGIVIDKGPSIQIIAVQRAIKVIVFTFSFFFIFRSIPPQFNVVMSVVYNLRIEVYNSIKQWSTAKGERFTIMTKITTKEKVLNLLMTNQNRYISGQEIANLIYVTRASVWKAIKALENDGYNIEAVTNRGYKLVSDKKTFEKDRIIELVNTYSKENDNAVEELSKLLQNIYVFDEVDSTNSLAKEYAEQHPGEDAVFIALSQKNGRGRRGRSFFSPNGTGIYLSFLLHPDMEISACTTLTCKTAVVICEAIKTVLNKDTKIKWVNDIYYDGKKVSGILTEASTSIEDGRLSYVVIGIGINVFRPEGGFPRELKDIAGALIEDKDIEGDNNSVFENIVSIIISKIYEVMNQSMNDTFIMKYREESFLPGNYVKINYFTNDEKSGNDYALVMGIDDDYHLVVRFEDGRTESLSTGEVSVVKY